MLGFDYQAGTCAAAGYSLTNLSIGGSLITDGRTEVTFDIGAATSINLQFTDNDPATSSAFYIDNILIKDLGTTLSISTNTVLNENFSGSSYPWIATNAGISYGTGQMHVSGTPPVLQYAGVARTLDLMPREIYRVKFDLTAKSVGTSTMSFAFSGGSATQYGSYDYSQPMTSGLTTYTFYVTPNAVQSTFYINVTSPSSSFSWDIDNFIVEMSTASPKPLYTAVANDLTDYYAFGSPMPGRSYHASAPNAYRYGFNGKENDATIASTGDGAQDYGMRIYNPSLGKFLSVDPLFRDYAYYGPYSFAGNQVISCIDLDGLENVSIIVHKDKTESMQIIYTEDQIKSLAKNSNAITFKVFYKDDKGKLIKETSQFEGPNKENEQNIFSMHAPKTNGAVCNDGKGNGVENDKSGVSRTDNFYSAIFAVPKPSSPKPPPPSLKSPVDLSNGFVLLTSLDQTWVPGSDDWSATGGMVKNGSFFEANDYGQALKLLATQIKADPSINTVEINVDLYNTVGPPGAKYIEPAMDIISVGIADQTQAFLEKEGVKNVKFEKHAKYTPGPGSATVNVKTKKK